MPGFLWKASTCFPTTAQSLRVGRMKFAGVLGWQNGRMLWQVLSIYGRLPKIQEAPKAALTFYNLFYFKMIFIFNTTSH